MRRGVTQWGARTGDEEDVDELGGEQVAVAAEEAAVVQAQVGGGRDGTVRVLDEVLGREQARRDEAPGAVPAVDGDGVQRVVQVQQDGHLVDSREYGSSGCSGCGVQRCYYNASLLRECNTVMAVRSGVIFRARSKTARRPLASVSMTRIRKATQKCTVMILEPVFNLCSNRHGQWQHLGADAVQDAGDAADDDGGPRVDGRAARCNGDQAGQGAVAERHQVVMPGACQNIAGITGCARTRLSLTAV